MMMPFQPSGQAGAMPVHVPTPGLGEPIAVTDPDIPRRLLWVLPVSVEPHDRAFRLRAQFTTAIDGRPATVTISSCGHPPLRGDDGAALFVGPVQQVSWTHSHEQRFTVTDRAELAIVRDPKQPHLTYLVAEASFPAVFVGIPDCKLV